MKTGTESQMAMLQFILRRETVSVAELADAWHVSYEAARVQLKQLLALALVEIVPKQVAQNKVGRPATRYRLSPKAYDLLPKTYDELAVDLIDAAAKMQLDGLTPLLSAVTDQKVAKWAPEVAGKSIEQRLEVLRNYFMENDPHTEVITDGTSYRLIHFHCPLLTVARKRPAWCSVHTSALSRLLGYRVSREERIQHGDGRCVFLVHANEPIDANHVRFTWEGEDTDKKKPFAPVGNKKRKSTRRKRR